MISENRAREIDYYFNHDNRARQNNFIIVSGIGTAVLLICKIITFSESLSFLILCTSVAVAFGMQLVNYHPQRYMDKIRAQGQRSFTGFQESGSLLCGRRLALLQVSGFIAAAIYVIVAPKTSEAQVLNRRLQRLLLTSRYPEARKLALDAVDLGIPLRPDVVRAIGNPTHVSINAGVEAFEAATRAFVIGRRLATVELDGGGRIEILVPLVYLPAGRYFLSGVVNAYQVSAVGDGQDKTYLLVNLEGRAGVPAVLNYSDGLLVDVLVSDLTATSRDTVQKSERSFLSVVAGRSKIVVSNVVVQLLYQTLDRIVWVDVTFDRCTIFYGGDWLAMTNVEFTDCQFNFAEGIPKYVEARFENGRGRRVSMRFQP